MTASVICLSNLPIKGDEARLRRGGGVESHHAKEADTHITTPTSPVLCAHAHPSASHASDAFDAHTETRGALGEVGVDDIIAAEHDDVSDEGRIFSYVSPPRHSTTADITETVDHNGASQSMSSVLCSAPMPQLLLFRAGLGTVAFG